MKVTVYELFGPVCTGTPLTFHTYVTGSPVGAVTFTENACGVFWRTLVSVFGVRELRVGFMLSLNRSIPNHMVFDWLWSMATVNVSGGDGK
jgi:hypothetical protein